jgi:hypothetical protein
MALHLIKLCVGVSEISELRQWVRDARKGLETLDHTTRMFPTRGDEILNGGSLYWVIRGMILCRQPIAGLVQVRGKDGISRCRIDFKAKIVPVWPTPRRAFQGWRYLNAEDAPADLKKDAIASEMDESMRRELSALGLL